jgi:hypothetical protein
MEPRIEFVKGGVAAVGNGWAVVAPTEQLAMARYHEAERRHKAIEARPDPHPEVRETRSPDSDDSARWHL